MQPLVYLKSLFRLKRIYFYRITILIVFILILNSLVPVYTFAKDDEPRPGGGMPTPVTISTAQEQSMPVWVDAQGTVTPRNYVNVMPRVAGQLESVSFKEGQTVKAGQLLANIDPRPFQILLDQAAATLMRDQAQLDGAHTDLEKYEMLLKQDSISTQQVTDQRTLVAQLKGTVASDKAAKDNAALQLNWTYITAPISGVVGLRQVDVGNMVGTNGAIGGGNSSLAGGVISSSIPIVTIAQVQPITVTFAIPQNQLPAVLERLRGAAIPVQAWDQRRTSQLDSGKVAAVDNQINSATGTVMIKAEFSNSKMVLYPNQFVNVRMLVDTVKNAIVVPSAAIATGGKGSYVYVIGNEDKVSLRPVTAGVTNKDLTSITTGLAVGERVVTDGLDRLKDGSKIQVVVPSDGSTAEGSGSPRHEKGGKPDGEHKRKPDQ
jgi:multidrug efflux system membrane fusion protein